MLIHTPSRCLLGEEIWTRGIVQKSRSTPGPTSHQTLGTMNQETWLQITS
jgi:hypothetical protein